MFVDLPLLITSTSSQFYWSSDTMLQLIVVQPQSLRWYLLAMYAVAMYLCTKDISTTSNYYASFIWWLVVEWSCALILCAVVLQWTLPLWFLLSHYYNCLLKCPILIVSLLNTILTVLSICFSLCVPWASHVLITTTAPVRRIIGASLSELIMTITHAWGKFVFVCVCKIIHICCTLVLKTMFIHILT